MFLYPNCFTSGCITRSENIITEWGRCRLIGHILVITTKKRKPTSDIFYFEEKTMATG